MVSGPAQYGTTALTLRCTKGDGKPGVSRCMPGAGLSLWRPGRPRLIGQPSSRTGENPPYGMSGGDRGNVGIMRSPVRASILPDCGGRSAMSVPTAIQTYLKVQGRWCYLYRAIDRTGTLVDVLFSEHRDMAAAQAFFRSAKVVTGVTPDPGSRQTATTAIPGRSARPWAKACGTGPVAT